MSKVLKVNTENTKVKVSTNKLPIIAVKRKLFKYLVDSDLSGKGSTKTKPVAKPLTDKQFDNVVKFVKSELDNVKDKYPNLSDKAVYEHIRNNLVGYVHRVNTIK